MKEKRGIDHLVLAVRDLEQARRRYTQLGFTVTPVAHHSWGTDNSLVQLQGNFLEILTVANPAGITEPSAGEFSFGAFNRDYLNAREGFSQLVFEGHDARGDRTEFAAAGLSDYANFDFERQAKLPDGSEVTVAFSLTFVTHPDIPDASFFTCQQHAPEYFWKPDYQRHDNSARLVSEVIMIAEAPDRFEGLFSGLQGVDAVTATHDALTVSTARGVVTVLSPALYADRFEAGPATDAPDGPHLAAYQVSCESLKSARECLDRSGIAYRGGYDRIQVGPADGFGVAIEFVS